MDEVIAIETEEDWTKIKKHNLNVVIDPMVFRTADVFLRGQQGWTQYRDARGGEQDPRQMWNAISSNIGSLCAFFDAMILEDRLPMYDYYSTFPPGIDMGASSTHWLVNTCNNIQEILVDVTVKEAAYLPVKQAALAQKDELRNIPSSTADDILNELSAFDYEWRPDLWQDTLPDVQLTPEEKNKRVLEAFRYGGLLFSGYAQQTGSDHVLQPKRSRLYLAASLGTARADDEKALFTELTKLSNEAPQDVPSTADLPERPTFLPYLLTSDPGSPLELLEHAMEMRRSLIVYEYREWWKEVIKDLEKGQGQARKDEIDGIAARLERKFRPKRENKINVQVQASLTGPGGGIGMDVDVAAILGWVLRQLPGYRYRKLLMRMVGAQRAYWHIDKHLHKIWSTS